ncbi:MAG: energy transducer TonB [Nitrospirota bacterium]
MNFSRNISFSLIFHMVFIAVALLSGGGSNKIKNNYIIVSVFDDNPDSYAKKVADNITKNINEESQYPRKTAGKIPEELIVQKKERDMLSDTVKLNENKKESVNIDIPAGGALHISKARGGSTHGNAPDVYIASSDHANSGDRFSAETEGKDIDNNPALLKIRTAIENNLIYPYIALRKRMEGTVLTEFSINAKGLPQNVRIIKSSGFNILDSAAEKTIIKASPFPAVKGNIEIPITFRLKGEN